MALYEALQKVKGGKIPRPDTQILIPGPSRIIYVLVPAFTIHMVPTADC